MDNMPKTKKEANTSGSRFYFTGNPCAYGHIAKRYTSNNSCHECNSLKKQKRRSKEDQAASSANYRQERYNKGRITGGEVRSIAESQGFKCAICSVDVRKTYHVDHKTPLSKGGENHPHNIQILCPSCNRTKATMTNEEMTGRLLYFIYTITVGKETPSLYLST